MTFQGEYVDMPTVYSCATCGKVWSGDLIKKMVADRKRRGYEGTGFLFENVLDGRMVRCPMCRENAGV